MAFTERGAAEIITKCVHQEHLLPGPIHPAEEENPVTRFI